MEKRSWLGHQIDLDFITTRDEIDYCFTLNAQQIATLLGLTEYIRWPTRWRSPSGQPIPKDFIEALHDQINFRLMNSVECGGGGSGNGSGCMHYVGEVFMSASETIPEGCLPCDGGTYNRVDYPDLYAALAVGLIVDADHFQTPDLSNGNTPIGVGQRLLNNTTGANPTQINIGTIIGSAYTVLSLNQMPAHTHPRRSSGVSEAVVNGTAGGGTVSYPSGTRGLSSETNTGEAGGSLEGTRSHGNYQPSTGVQFVIQAVDCAAGSALQLQYSDCVLQTSPDGETWTDVPGWQAWQDCLPDILEADDLQFRVENCILQYSKDGGEVWNNVFNWNSLFNDGCVLTPDNLQFRVENCILQYSKDGGEVWNNVFNWNSLPGVDCWNFSNVPNFRCKTAVGLIADFWLYHLRPMAEYIRIARGASGEYMVVREGAKDEFNIPCLTSAAETLFNSFFEVTWNLYPSGDLEQYIIALDDVFGLADIQADMFYALSETGELTEAAYAAFLERAHRINREPPEMWYADGFATAYEMDKRTVQGLAYDAPGFYPDALCVDFEDVPPPPQTPTLSFLSSSSNALEGDIVELEVQLSTAEPLGNDVAVQILYVGGTAQHGTDLFTVNPLLTFPAGSSDGHTITCQVSIYADSEPEPAETAVFGLGAITGGAMPGTIVQHTITIAGSICSNAQWVLVDWDALTWTIGVPIRAYVGTPPGQYDSRASVLGVVEYELPSAMIFTRIECGDVANTTGTWTSARLIVDGVDRGVCSRRSSNPAFIWDLPIAAYQTIRIEGVTWITSNYDKIDYLRLRQCLD